MPRKRAKLVVTAHRTAEARRIVGDQHKLIERLKALGHPTLDAERALQTYVSALKHLEDHERRLGKEGEAKKRETKKPQSN
jgi:hypothetical protein